VAKNLYQKPNKWVILFGRNNDSPVLSSGKIHFCENGDRFFLCNVDEHEPQIDPARLVRRMARTREQTRRLFSKRTPNVPCGYHSV
jgi:hypothetical protein